MMKKRFIFNMAWLTAGLLMTFASCNSEDELAITPGTDISTTENRQALKLQVENSGEGMVTRAGRPLLGNDADQKIDYVALHFTQKQSNENQYHLIRRIVLPWNDEKNPGVKPYAENGHGKMLELVLNRCPNGKLTPGNYKIFAIGYSASSDYTLSPSIGNDEETGATNSADKINDILLNEVWADNAFNATLKSTATDAEEIFAGQLDISVDEENKIAVYTNTSRVPLSNALTLHRQVAGVIGYFTNIPASIKVTVKDEENKEEVKELNSRYIRLVSVNKNSKVKLGQFNSDFTDDGTEADFIVNGAASCIAGATYHDGGDAHVLFEIDLKDWFPLLNDYNKDGFLDWKDVRDYVNAEKTDDYSPIWTNPHRSEDGNCEASFVKGSAFSGKFVIPFEKGENNTLELQLLAEDRTQILRSWTVKTDKLHEGSSVDGTSWEKFDKDNLHYNVYRNHAYNIGIKKSANPSGSDPDQPTEDDSPVDLSSQELTITVDDKWNDIYDMGVDYEDINSENK